MGELSMSYRTVPAFDHVKHVAVALPSTLLLLSCMYMLQVLM